MGEEGSGQPPHISKDRNSDIVVEPETKSSSCCEKKPAQFDLWHKNKKRTNEESTSEQKCGEKKICS